ncbi:Hypothetical protein ETEE_1319 [Edwardsiella anguillarum ET080813]|uniref:Uncharacterized protein n=1 Tax=Edwardsiella anguillarum ET080813 TaxID=667120 RepID=A0A076LM54_9GAMM|nr:Hypothetical protein ETEE_1319 [Edwardsiella anguillarum ET080813]
MSGRICSALRLRRTSRNRHPFSLSAVFCRQLRAGMRR